MRKFTLKNDFHNTDTVVIPKDFEILYDGSETVIFLSPTQERRVYKTLCGMVDCQCSGIAGVRQSGVEIRII